MKHFFLVAFLSIATPPTVAADATSGAEQPAFVERQLLAVERQVDAYYSALKDFEKGVADFESNPRLKQVACAGIKNVLTKSLTEYRANAALLEQQRQSMSEDEKNRLSSSQEKLAEARTEISGCM